MCYIFRVLVLAALADPVRREIVELLTGGDVVAGEIAARFPVSRPAVSRHLRVLREAGLVRSEVHGQQRVYVLERAALAELDGWLDRFRPLPSTTPRTAPGPAARLGALATELRRGRRERRAADQDPTRKDDSDDRSAG
jgi:DNA-binding transcriptional ArsR family regulator